VVSGRGEEQRFYIFSVNREMLGEGLGTAGMIYILPGETCEMTDSGVVRLDGGCQRLVDLNCRALRIMLYSLKWSEWQRQSTPCKRLGQTTLPLRDQMATEDNPKGFRTLVDKSFVGADYERRTAFLAAGSRDTDDPLLGPG
jgi:hypothetical protein